MGEWCEQHNERTAHACVCVCDGAMSTLSGHTNNTPTHAKSERVCLTQHTHTHARTRVWGAVALQYQSRKPPAIPISGTLRGDGMHTHFMMYAHARTTLPIVIRFTDDDACVYNVPAFTHRITCINLFIKLFAHGRWRPSLPSHTRRRTF